MFEPTVLCILGKCFTNCATSPALAFIYFRSFALRLLLGLQLLCILGWPRTHECPSASTWSAGISGLRGYAWLSQSWWSRILWRSCRSITIKKESVCILVRPEPGSACFPSAHCDRVGGRVVAGDSQLFSPFGCSWPIFFRAKQWKEELLEYSLEPSSKVTCVPLSVPLGQRVSLLLFWLSESPLVHPFC